MLLLPSIIERCSSSGMGAPLSVTQKNMLFVMTKSLFWDRAGKRRDSMMIPLALLGSHISVPTRALRATRPFPFFLSLCCGGLLFSSSCPPDDPCGMELTCCAALRAVAGCLFIFAFFIFQRPIRGSVRGADWRIDGPGCPTRGLEPIPCYGTLSDHARLRRSCVPLRAPIESITGCHHHLLFSLSSS